MCFLPPALAVVTGAAVIVINLDIDNDDPFDAADADDIMAPPPKAKRKTPAATATAAKKATAGSKTSGETDSDYPKEEPIRVVSKMYGLDTYDKHTVTEYADGANDYYVVQFYVTGAVWEGGYLATLSEDGYVIKWSHPIEGLLFRIEHLKSIMGDDTPPSTSESARSTT